MLRARLHRATPINQGDEAPVTEPKSTQENPKEFDYHDDYMDLGILSKLSSHFVEEVTVPEEEDKIRSADEKDTVIFSNIDIAFFDDSLLTNMPKAFSQRPPPLRAILQSVITIFQGRVGPLLFKGPAGNTKQRESWPWTLSQRARVALVDMLVEGMVHDLHHVERGLICWDRLQTPDSEWAKAFVCLILLVSPREVAPRSVTRLFKVLQDYNSWGPFNVFAFQIRTLARYDPDWPTRSLLFLARSLDRLSAEKSEACFQCVVSRGYVNQLRWQQTDTYCRLLERNWDDSDGDVIAPTLQRLIALLEVACVILHNYTLEQTEGQDEFPQGIRRLLKFVLDATSRVRSLSKIDFRNLFIGASDGPGLRLILTDLFTTPQSTRKFLRFFATHTDSLFSSSCPYDSLSFPHPISSSRESMLILNCILLFMIHGTEDDAIKILAVCTEFFISQSTCAFPAFHTYASCIMDSTADLLHLCSVIWTYKTNDDEETVAAWQKLFTAIYACYELHFGTSGVSCQYRNFPDKAYRGLQGCLHHTSPRWQCE